MPTGSADERMAFVLETEAKLDGIRQARAEITGVGTDTDALSVRLSQMSETSRNAFEKLSAAEQKAVAGFIGVKQTSEQSAKAMDTTAQAANRTTIAMEAMVNPAFAAAAKRNQAANDAQGKSIETISPKARSAANAISMLTMAAATGGGSAQSMAIAAGTLTSSLAHLSTNAAIAAGASGIGALVVVAATIIPLLNRMRDASEEVSGSFSRTLTLADESTAGVFLRIAQARKEAAIKAYGDVSGGVGMGTDLVATFGDKAARKKAMDEAIKDEQLAIAQVFTARRNAVRKEVADAAADATRARQESAQSRGMGEEMRGRTLQLGLERTAPELAAVTGIQMQQAQRDEAIDKMTTLSQEERDRRKIESARQAQAEITKIYDDAAEKRMAKADEEAKRTEQIEQRKAAKRLDIAKSNIHAIVTTEGSVIQTLRRLALAPIVDELEGIAAREAVKALASWPDFAAMAAHGAAAIAATAAARQVASWGGGGTRGGGGGIGAPGGGAPTSTFEPRGATGGAFGVMGLTIITQNSLGADHIQNLSFELNRAGILRRPIVQLPPTSGITVSTN